MKLAWRSLLQYARRSSGSPTHYLFGPSEKELRDAVSYGVVKVNVDTDMQYAFTRAVADHVLTHYSGVLKVDGGVGDKETTTTRVRGGAPRKPLWQMRLPSSAS